MEHGFMSNLIKKSWMDSFTHSCALWFGGFTKVLLIHSYSVMSLISNSLNVLSFQWLPILVSFNHLLITVNCSFNFLFYLSYCRGNRGSKSKWKWIPNWEFWFFWIQGRRNVKKILVGSRKKSKINYNLVQIKNPHFLHFQMAISVVDINLLLCEKQKFHDVCLGVSYYCA